MLRDLLIDKYPNARTLIGRVQNIEDYEGLTDDEYILREAEWVVEDFTEDTGHDLHDEYNLAKRALKATKNGKQYKMTMDINMRNIHYKGYTPWDVARAREVLDEVKTTKEFIKEARKWHNRNQKSGG